MHTVVLSLVLRCWWCCSCSTSKVEEFEEGHCMGDESYACFAKCWLVWKVAGGGSRVPRALSGRYYEMYIQMDVECVHSPLLHHFIPLTSTPPSFNLTTQRCLINEFALSRLTPLPMQQGFGFNLSHAGPGWWWIKWWTADRVGYLIRFHPGLIGINGLCVRGCLFTDEGSTIYSTIYSCLHQWISTGYYWWQASREYWPQTWERVHYIHCCLR